MYNEPSLGLYFTQQHIHNAFPVLLNELDKLELNRKKVEKTLKDISITERELSEITSLSNEYSYNMLTKIQAINYVVSHKGKKIDNKLN